MSLHLLYRNGLIALCIFCWAGLVCSAQQDKSDVRIAFEKVIGNDKFCVTLQGLPADKINPLASLSALNWKHVFPVYYGNSPGEDSLPILGTYEIQSDRVVFVPRFRLDEGATYTAVFHPQKHGMDGDSVSESLLIPEYKPKKRSYVHEVYPTGDELPENLLRFYIYFSQPMSKGGVYDFLALLDEEGNEIELPFLELDEELWDPKQIRFTLLFDPGRIKKELKPNIDTGIPMVAGNTYTFVVKKDWKDANGNPLLADFKKTFHVVESDRESPDPKDWEIVAPKAGTRDPLLIHFGEPLDHAIVNNMIHLMHAENVPVKCHASIELEETVLLFTPDEPWRSETYTLHINPRLEDCAGNSIMKHFDVDLMNAEPLKYTDTVKIPVHINE